MRICVSIEYYYIFSFTPFLICALISDIPPFVNASKGGYKIIDARASGLKDVYFITIRH